MELKQAEKKKVKLKVGFSGPSGYGKTYSALLMAYGVTGDWTKIAVVDTENKSASLYADLGPFQTIDFEPPFSPERYIDAIRMCEKAGIEVCIVDSISPEWDGVGGCLQIQERLGGRYQDWAKVTPRHTAFVQEILQSNMHVFVTIRKKQDYEMSNENGKAKVIKLGLREIQKEGFEYELTLNFELLNDKHLAKASKDRTGLFMDVPEEIITPATGKKLVDWANSGVDEVDYIISAIKNTKNRIELTKIWENNQHLKANPKLLKAIEEQSKLYPKEN